MATAWLGVQEQGSLEGREDLGSCEPGQTPGSLLLLSPWQQLAASGLVPWAWPGGCSRVPPESLHIPSSPALPSSCPHSQPLALAGVGRGTSHGSRAPERGTSVPKTCEERGRQGLLVEGVELMVNECPGNQRPSETRRNCCQPGQRRGTSRASAGRAATVVGSEMV